MKTKVFINGSEGTTGLRIHERFMNRSDIELIGIDPELRKDPREVSKKINSSDITFFCLPDAAAIEALKLVENPAVRILDTSTAHRTADGWTYGFPELSDAYHEKISCGKRIAVPGCHATGFISLAYPLVKSGLLPSDALLSCTSISGYSGAGKKAIAQYTDNEVRHENALSPDPASGSISAAMPGIDSLISPRQYALAQQHKHLKEMSFISGLSHAPVFMPFICDFYSGMSVSIPLHAEMFSKKASLNDVRDIFLEQYAGKKLVKVLPADDGLIRGNFIPANTISGSDTIEIMVYGNDERMVVTSRFDNLGKGASGAAIQCMNLMLGIPEETGLNI